MKFGKQQHIKNSMEVTRLNIKIFTIQDGGRPPSWKILEMPRLAYTNGPIWTQLVRSHPIVAEDEVLMGQRH